MHDFQRRFRAHRFIAMYVVAKPDNGHIVKGLVPMPSVHAVEVLASDGL